MFDIDAFIHDTMEVKIFGETITVKEMSPRMYSEMNRIEKDFNAENAGEKRVKVAKLFLNNNMEGKVYTEEQIEKIPFPALDTLCRKVASMKAKVDNDPNSESPSQKGK